jgi:sulfur carrier protein
MISVNGEETPLRPGEPLASALAQLGVSEQASGVAVAVDGEVVPRGQWSSLILHDGARVEVLGAMQGG